jgi:hypothetical protein
MTKKMIRTVLTEEGSERPLKNVVIEMIIVPYWTDIDGYVVEPGDWTPGDPTVTYHPGGMLAIGETDSDGIVDWVLSNPD